MNKQLLVASVLALSFASGTEANVRKTSTSSRTVPASVKAEMGSRTDVSKFLGEVFVEHKSYELWEMSQVDSNREAEMGNYLVVDTTRKAKGKDQVIGRDVSLDGIIEYPEFTDPRIPVSHRQALFRTYGTAVLVPQLGGLAGFRKWAQAALKDPAASLSADTRWLIHELTGLK